MGLCSMTYATSVRQDCINILDSDFQCDMNHTGGLFCGACALNYSLMLPWQFSVQNLLQHIPTSFGAASHLDLSPVRRTGELECLHAK